MIPYRSFWLKPALAGVLLLASWLALAWATRCVVRAASTQRSRLWPGWAWLAPLAELLVAVAALVSGLSLGAWLVDDAGLRSPTWRELLTWLPGYAAGMALWFALLFGIALSSDAWRGLLTRRADAHGFVPLVARLTRDETLLAALRAALVPALGPYYGAWAAAAVRLAAGWWFPAGGCVRYGADRNEWLLQRAFDVMSTVVVIMTGSAAVALATRVLASAAVTLAQAVSHRRAERDTSLTKAQGPRR